MNVILIGRYVIPYPFSEHRLDYPMLKEWAKHITQLEVIVQSQDGTYHFWQEDNLKVHYAPIKHKFLRNTRFLLWVLRRIILIHKRNPVDIVNGSDLLGSFAGILLRPWIRAKVIVQMQGDFIRPGSLSYSSIRGKLIKVWAKYLCKHADMIRCLYDAAVNEVASLGINHSRITSIPSRCDVNLFDSKKNPRFNSERTRLLYVGNLVKEKGLIFLIKSFADLIRQFPSTMLTIVGKGPLEKELKRLVHDMSLDRQVEFLGYIPHDEIPSIMQEADLFVFPSLSEATPRVIMEAMAMELPVVATKVGGLPEMIEDGVTGLLVKPGSSIELTKAITWIFNHPEWVIAASQKARQHVLKYYTLERHVEQMIALHQKVLKL